MNASQLKRDPRTILGQNETLMRKAKLRFVFERDRKRCNWCDRVTRIVKPKAGHNPPSDMATIDHIVTKLRGGGDNPENVMLACFRCNNRRGNTDARLYAVLIARPLPARAAALFQCEGSDGR